MGVCPKAKDFILFLTLKSQKFINPSLPQVINQIGVTGENDTAFTGKSTTELGFYYNL